MTVLATLALAASSIFPSQPHSTTTSGAGGSVAPPGITHRVIVNALAGPLRPFAVPPVLVVGDGPRVDASGLDQPAPVPVQPDDEPPPAVSISAAGLAVLRACESSGRYNQRGTWDGHPSIYFGAYQFDLQTWRDLARRRAPELAGVNPADASPADQDRMASMLWAERGAEPWPNCGPKAAGR